MSHNNLQLFLSRALSNHMSKWLGYLPGRWGTPAEMMLIGSSILVGAGTGLGAVFFIWLLKQFNTLAHLTQIRLGYGVGILLPMTLAGLVVGFLIDKWAREAKGHGVPEVMEAIALHGGHIRPPVAAIKVMASSLTIGMGGSAGREGPIVQVGSALGSTLGQLLHLSAERVRILVACGAAAGIAATFNAPIAGAIFALEVILGRFTVRHFGTVVLSAVAASVVSHAFLGNQPAFLIPAYPLNHVAELPVYILLGVLAALLSVLFIRALYFVEGVFDRWSIPFPLKTAAGMALTGTVALLLPQGEVLGPGLELIGQAVARELTLSMGMLAALLGLKLVATCFTLGSGNSGGVFAPTLFMGALLGGIIGSIANNLWPGITPNPEAFAVVGMAAAFAGAAHAPITAVLIVFEMSGDYKLILPLMLAAVLSTLIAEALFSESVYTFKLKLKGIHLQRGRDEDVLGGMKVQDVMARDIDKVTAETPFAELVDLLARTHHHGLPVLDNQGKLWGVVTITDVDRAASTDTSNTTVADIGTPRSRLVVAYPDESIGEALQRMGSWDFGRLPVVARHDPNQLLGLIRRQTIVRAYNMALVRRAELQHRTKQIQLNNLDGAEFVTPVLQAIDQVVGCTVQEVADELPRECVLVSIRRNGRLLIPHGDTVLQAGDQLTAFVRSQDVDVLYQCLTGRGDS